MPIELSRRGQVTTVNRLPRRFPGGGHRPTGPALAGGARPVFGGGNLPALGYNPGITDPAQQIAYQQLLSAGATPQFAAQVSRSGSQRVNAIISRLSVGQIYQILGRVTSGAELVSELNKPGGGILSDIVGGVLAALGAAIGIVGAAFGQAELLPLGAAISAEGVRELTTQSDSRQPRINATPALAPLASRAIRAIANYLEPGPGPDGQPQAGRTSQGVPILDQTTDCPTCGGANLPPEGSSAPQLGDNLPMTSDARGPTLQPPLDTGSPDLELPPPPQPGGELDNPPGYPPVAYQPSNNYPYQPELLNPLREQPGNQPIPDQIRALRDQLNDEIQTEQRQLMDQRGQQNRVNQIRDQIDQLKQLEKVPPSQRDIPSELALKHRLMNDLDNLERGQPALQIPNQPTAPELRGPGPQGGGQPQEQPGNQPALGHAHPTEAVQFCVGCQSQEDAILFLNGEPAACSVIPGSTTNVEVPHG